MKGSSPARDTWDMDDELPGPRRPFEIHRTRWLSEIWIVIARDEEEADRLFDEGQASGPVVVREEGSYTQEVKVAR